MNFEPLDDALFRLAAALGTDTLFLNPLIAVVLLGITCGSIGSTVVGNRMAFFSDAMAHTAFAGVALAVLSVIFFAGIRSTRGADPYLWVVLPVMIGTGTVVGVLMTAARERTGLTNDTVIGVFFAASTGLAAALRQLMQSRALFTMEDFLFGNPLGAGGGDIASLAVLALCTGAALMWMYNPLLLGGFNPSLARSRRLPHRLASYAFIVLLAVVVNLTVRIVGVLLINALLVVPAAAAVNLGSNLREVFWLSLGLCLLSVVGGVAVCWEAETRLNVRLGYPGTIVLVSVALFTLSAVIGPMRKRRPEQPPLPAT